MINKNSKILITGASGLLGSAIVRELIKLKYQNIIKLNSKNCNLLHLHKVESTFKKYQPEFVIHCANKVYGIGGNQKFKFLMQIENQIINSNILSCCYNFRVKKIVCIGSAAGYSPKFKYNIKEKNFLVGLPHKSEYDYATSKRVLLQMLQSYSSSKLKYNYIIMNNLYGINDNFNIQTGHVVPSLIHKCYLARFSGKDFEVWGNPKSKRCLLYVDDAAKVVVDSLKFKQNLIFNLSSKKETTIFELQKIIKKHFEFNKKTKWVNKDFPAVNRRKLSLDILNKSFKIKETKLEDGLALTINWLKKNYAKIKT